MSEGFETKSADSVKNIRRQPKSRDMADIGSIQQSLVEHFSDIKDHRVERTKKHQFTDILVIAILAIIAGAQGWEDIENYGISKQKWLEEFLALPNGIPSDDTFRRVFEFIDPEVLNRCFLRWVETLVTKIGGEIIPIDGKTIRGSYDRNQGQSALHLISAWASEHSQGKRISNPIDTVVLGFAQSTNKFKITTLSQGVGLTFSFLYGQKT